MFDTEFKYKIILFGALVVYLIFFLYLEHPEALIPPIANYIDFHGSE